MSLSRDLITSGAPAPGTPDWEHALAALRLGHGSAAYYLDEYAWGEELDLSLARDWTVMRTGVPWSQVRHYARLAWELAHRLGEPEEPLAVGSTQMDAVADPRNPRKENAN